MARANAWAIAEIGQLKQHLADGLTPSAICREMNHRSYTAVYHQCLKYVYSDNMPVTQEKDRPCLKCRSEFLSSWPGNRVCGRCRQNNEIYGQFIFS